MKSRTGLVAASNAFDMSTARQSAAIDMIVSNESTETYFLNDIT